MERKKRECSGSERFGPGQPLIFAGPRMERISIESTRKEEMIDVTAGVRERLNGAGLVSGLCMVFTPHTTAAVTINENADPDVRRDMLLALRQAVPDDLDYRHFEENSPAHLKSSLLGCSVTVPVEKGELVLGRWQGIYFCEFDGPRHREIFIKFLKG